MNSMLVEVARQVWPFPDRPPMEVGAEAGIAWGICRGPVVGVNGYVLIPAEGHPWSAGIPCRDNGYGWTEYAYDDLVVHGGITYGVGSCPGSDTKWLGFDTAHAGDIWDAEFDPHDMSSVCRRSWGTVWTVELVTEEVKSLARQLAGIT